MIDSIYNYELYSVYVVYAGALKNTVGGKIGASFDWNSGVNKDTAMIVPDDIEVLPVTNTYQDGEINIDSFIQKYTAPLSMDKTLFLHPNCAIPRAKVTQKYKRVVKPSKADLCVVPYLRKTTFIVERVAIFVNNSKGKAYIVKPNMSYINNKTERIVPDICDGFPIGSKVTDINPKLIGSYTGNSNYRSEIFNNENWQDFLNSELLHNGYMLVLGSKSHWIAELIHDRLHNIVAEDVVLDTLGDNTNEITKDTYDNIMGMLNSTDKTVVGLGLKTLAELDYKKYKNTAIYLLNHSIYDWRGSDMKNSSNVKFMIKYLNQWNYRWEHYTEANSIEDFMMLKSVVEKEFEEKIDNLVNNFKSRFPFANLGFNHSIEFWPKLADEVSEEESENPDNED